MKFGKVRYIHPDRGFGFLEDENKERVFFHPNQGRIPMPTNRRVVYLQSPVTLFGKVHNLKPPQKEDVIVFWAAKTINSEGLDEIRTMRWCYADDYETAVWKIWEQIHSEGNQIQDDVWVVEAAGAGF